MDNTPIYIKMSEKAKEIQEGWKKKKSHIEDKVFVHYLNETIFIVEELEFWNDKDEGGDDREYVTFHKEKLRPIPFTKFDKDAFYKYDDGELNVIFIPTQSQLQGMVKEWKKNFRLCFSENGLSVSDAYNEFQYFIENESMEQLWLGFVMFEKFNKKWNGNDWVKI